jgi:hypothetical protein
MIVGNGTSTAVSAVKVPILAIMNGLAATGGDRR